MGQKTIGNEARRVVESVEADRQSQKPGDNRTPDKTIGQVKYADGQGVACDDRGQERPADKKRAQKSQLEGPAAYAPHEESERSFPKGDAAKRKTGEF